MNTPKPWYASRTVLLNGLIAALLLLPAIRKAWRDGDWTPVALVALALLNLWLRVGTDRPIVFSGQTTIGAIAGDDIGALTEGK